MKGSALRCFTESGGARGAQDAATAHLKAGDCRQFKVSATLALSRLKALVGRHELDECVHASYPKDPDAEEGVDCEVPDSTHDVLSNSTVSWPDFVVVELQSRVRVELLK
jgi:hypothetical protein